MLVIADARKKDDNLAIRMIHVVGTEYWKIDKDKVIVSQRRFGRGSRYFPRPLGADRRSINTLYTGSFSANCLPLLLTETPLLCLSSRAYTGIRFGGRQQVFAISPALIRPPGHIKPDQPSINDPRPSINVEGRSPRDMATQTSRKQTPSPAAHNIEDRPGQFTAFYLMNGADIARARAASLLIAAALCNALAGQVYHAMSATDPRWLAHAASLTIRAFGVDIANRLEISKVYGLLLHLSVMALGWALDRTFLAVGVFIR